MNKFKRILAVTLAIAMLLSMSLALSACGDQPQQGGTETTAPAGEKTNYAVSIKSAGGMPLEGVAVSVYADSTMADLQGYDETDAEGKATVQLPQREGYAISLSGVPKGYATEASYSFNGTSAEIVLTSSVVAGESVGDTTFKVGDVMYDFTVTTPDGTGVTLSEMLKEKKMVLINFWYTGCSWCVTEFPFMEQAYQTYKDDVGIIAVDPLGEGDAAIAAFPGSMGLELSFPMAECPSTWSNAFGITGYPTSVIIDRYGVITLIEAGAITSLRPFTSLFETMTADDYQQKLYSSIGELVTQVKPTYEMDTSENIGALINSGDIEVTYRPETEDDNAEYIWPFIEAEKNGEKCLKASNQGMDDTYAILYADVTLKAGQALGFDFLRSTEAASDVMYVIVNDEDINTISGAKEEWESCYPVVAQEDGVYEVALCFVKDSSDAVGDDTVYIKNMRVVNEADIDAVTHLPQQAATTQDGFEYIYVDLAFNENDGYYHVGTVDGPLLLADLMGYTQFSEESSIWEMAYAGDIVLDGVDYVDKLETYSNYAINSNLYGICTVNQELYELLQIVDQVAGFDDEDPNEWMKACKYFKAYGPDAKQLEDPIAGQAPFCAFQATLGKDVPTNYFYYNRAIMPRGMFAEFIPSTSGVYRITSHNESAQGVDGWIFNADKEVLLTYEHDERTYENIGEVSIVFYMEAGTPYYINIAFWDLYEVGYIYYDIEYLGATYDHFRLCSPGYFTYDTNATGEAMYHLIAGGIDVALGDDGYYHHDLGDGKLGSIIYADFTGVTLINTPIATVDGVKGLIDQGAFDYSKSEDDTLILSVIESCDGDEKKIEEKLKTQWGDSYEENLWLYEDVKNGKFHGTGEDHTATVSKYLDKIIRDGSEKDGCVAVTEELAEILLQLMSKYTFENVDHSWTKLCYYYDYMGRG